MSIGHNSAVRGTFADFKTVKTRGVCQLIIEVPIEAADHALAVLGGVPQAKAEQWVGIAPVAAPDAPEAPTETERPSTADWSEAKRKMVQRSGIVRKEDSFQQFLATRYHALWQANPLDSWEATAAEIIHQLCFVESCRDLEPGERSGHCFTELMRLYDASQRGETEAALMEQRR